MRRISFKFSALRRVHLHDYHLSLGGKMVPFAGYEMPVQYNTGVLKEHLKCREFGGWFDVSHMGQVLLKGKDHVKVIETVTTGEYATKKTGQSQLCLILNEEAGILDDTIVTRREDHAHMVVNAGNKFTDIEHIQAVIKNNHYDCQLEYLADRPLIAVQGPEAARIVSTIFGEQFATLPFMSMLEVTYKGEQVLINRCGYTGEDGYEISINKNAQALADELIKYQITPCGLGARDSLRLEAGLCLHGHEMDHTTTPHQAKLMWTVRKKNKQGVYNETVPFIGRANLLKKNKPEHKRMGFIAQKGIIRSGDIFQDGVKVGVVTSGTYSPCLKKGIGFASIKTELCQEGLTLSAIVREQEQPLVLATVPFVPAKYYK